MKDRVSIKGSGSEAERKYRLGCICVTFLQCVFSHEKVSGWPGVGLDDTVSINRFWIRRRHAIGLVEISRSTQLFIRYSIFWQFALQLSTVVALIKLLIMDLTALKSSIRDQGYSASDHFVLLTELLSNAP